MIDKTYFTHFIYFLLFGIVFPRNYIGALALGIGWEFIEEAIDSESWTRDFLRQHIEDYKQIWKFNQKNKSVHLVISMVGYYMGNKLRGFSPL